MSGFEVAGLVLGAIPIVCAAAKHLKPIVEGASFWWSFETKFEAFAAGIRAQEIFYRQVLERLIEHLDIPETRCRILLTEPNSSLWHEAELREEVKLRFQEDQYRWIMDNLVDLNNAVLELQQLLLFEKVRLEATLSGITR